MPRLVLQGSQWGDEGKGKITDYLAQKADVVVRFQGGNNAGHTIVFDNHKYALKLLPSGIFSKHIKNVLAQGMVINVEALLNEIQTIKEQGITSFQLYISSRAHVIMPYHLDLDGASESLLGDNKIGTTKKGIGPCYTDKYARFGIRIADLLEKDALKARLEAILPIKNKELESYGLKPYDLEYLLNLGLSWGDKIRNHVTDTSILLTEEIKKDSKILFEGAQGAMLCIENGTYPYVTSSSPLAASVSINAGIAPKYVDKVLGIMKAYTTRVGEGPFPTELNNALGDAIREKGHEYGTVTHRPRRVGYLDLVVINHAKRVSGIDYLAIMLLDVLTGLDLKICYAYELDGKVIDYIPATLTEYQRVKPLYVSLPSWNEDISKVTCYQDLPDNCKAYLKKIEELTSLKISMISVGPSRENTIVIEDLL